jgi:hypothetical protein
MSRRSRQRQSLEESPELPEVLREIYAELEAESCDCFQRVNDILRFAGEHDRDEPRRGTADARR